MFRKVVLPPGRLVSSLVSGTVWAQPSSCWWAARQDRSLCLGKGPPSLPPWSTPQSAPQTCSTTQEARALGLKESPRLLAHWKCSFGLMYNQAYQLCTQKALIQLGEICTDLPPFSSGALEMWWECASGRQSKDEISGGWKTMKRNSPLDKSRGVGHFHLKQVPRERRALKVTDFCKHFCSDGSQWNYCFLWKERNHSSLPYKIRSVYFSKYVPPRFAANHKKSWHFMIPYYKFQKRLSSPLKELLQKQRLGAGSVLKQRDSCI